MISAKPGRVVSATEVPNTPVETIPHAAMLASATAPASRPHTLRVVRSFRTSALI